MAPERIVDPRLFIVESALIHWASEARERGLKIERRGPQFVVALRWYINGARPNPANAPAIDVPGDADVQIPEVKLPDVGIGLPTGPFTVWRRPAQATAAEQPIGFTPLPLTSINGQVVKFDEPLAMVRLTLLSASAVFPVYGLANAPDEQSVATMSHVQAGDSEVELRGPYLDGVIIHHSMTLTGVVGVPVGAYQALADWEPIEIVGLPVDPVEWSKVGDHADDQGPVGSPMKPRDAAIDRVVRGTPPFGWAAEVKPGVAAPPWEVPNPEKLVDEVGENVIPGLRTVLTAKQFEQPAIRVMVKMDPPTTLDGTKSLTMSEKGKVSTGEVSPVMVLCAATASDPFLSLALGYGTNVDGDRRGGPLEDIDGSGLLDDYMITAPYAHGLGVESQQPVELVAYALAPAPPLMPFAPAELEVSQRADIAPPEPDADWGASNVAQWTRPQQNGLARVASFAAARSDPGKPFADALMAPRESGGLKPIISGRGGGDTQGNWAHFTDVYMGIPNDPGTRTARYSIATQSLFGIWCPWQNADVTAAQPATTPPHVVSARVAVTAPHLVLSKVCEGTLTVDIAYDWTDRTPGRIVLRGRMFTSPDRATTPSILVSGLGLDRGLGISGPEIAMTFAGDDASVSGGAKLMFLDAGGEKLVTSGAKQEPGVRRYRLAIPITANFTATPNIGIALWTHADERLAPGRETDSHGPTIVYASDPVAPPVPIDLVPLASLPDAEGRSHAHISWPAAPGAAGYSIYTSDESTLLAFYGVPEPDGTATLSERRSTLVSLWRQNPARRPFSRLGATLLSAQTTSQDVTMPRGATGIHVYVVVSASPGQVEGPWPAGDPKALEQQLILRVAPVLATPPPPMLEVTANPDGTVAVRVSPRAGHRVGRIDVHRVRIDDAARSLDTMGPPVATVVLGLPAEISEFGPIEPTVKGTPGWTVETAFDGTPTRFDGSDTPGAGWRRVWYRAVAWAAPEWGLVNAAFPHEIAELGMLAGRSAPSNAVSVMTPPLLGPDLSDLAVTWPGGSAANVRLDWSTLSPLQSSPLGTHTLEIDVRDVTPGVVANTLVSYEGELGATLLAQPALGDAFWRVIAGSGANPSRFRGIVHRTSVAVALDVRVRIADPLGRSAERTLHIAPGSVLPEPEIGDIVVIKVGADTILSFSSGAPAAQVVGLSYTLKITAVHGGSVPPTPIPVPPPIDFELESMPTRPGPLQPSSAKAASPKATAAAAPVAAAGRGSTTPQIKPGPTINTLELPFGQIPLDTGQPPTLEPLEVRRKGNGARRTYAVRAHVAVDVFTVLVTAPDGRSASFDVQVP